MADGPQVPQPVWEHRFPGRFDYELKELRLAASDLRVDAAALEGGALIIDLDWRCGSEILPLRAVYPDWFPYFRPSVALRARPFPRRHSCPMDGDLCLLGRHTGQWQSNMTLRQLLDEQLELAIKGTHHEDPQGEPAETWWNFAGLPDSYVLVDSVWNLGEADNGLMKLVYRELPHRHLSGKLSLPCIQAAVVAVLGADGRVLAELSSPPPIYLAKRMTIPWVRRREELLPAEPLQDLREALRDGNGLLSRMRVVDVGGGWQGKLGAIVYDSELQRDVRGHGWLFPLLYGPREAFRPSSGRRPSAPAPSLGLLKTLRAGLQDLGFRVSAVKHLAGKRIGVVGLGAIGAPISLSLARNRCAELHLLDFDDVEPGNSIRWALGATAWGRSKLEALAKTIESDEPATRVVRHKLNIGPPSAAGGASVNDLTAFVGQCDVVVDATASPGVTALLADLCRDARVPLVATYATPTVTGGVVATYWPSGGCPNCLEYAWHRGEIVRPPGLGTEGDFVQPPGCAEATFVGSDYDLHELSLQTVRTVVSIMSAPVSYLSSDILTLSLDAPDGGRSAPAWQQHSLAPHPECSCRKTR